MRRMPRVVLGAMLLWTMLDVSTLVDPASYEQRLTQALGFMQQGAWQQAMAAIGELDRKAALTPEWARLWFVRGILAQKLQDPETARQAFERVWKDYPPLADLQEVYLLSVPELPNRPARVCSIEQEINDGGREVTQMLYDLGFAETDSQIGYSASGRAGTVAVKSDASLSGDDPAEIVYSRYRLWDRDSAESLSQALARVRQLARETTPGVVRVNKSAGTHVHVSATAEDGSRIGPSEMAALHEIFSYAEDFLYSIAAAGWDSHRSPIGGHGTYCKPVPKLASGERGTAFRVNTLMRGDRYFGLNFQRLLAAATNCSCGAARFGEWSACECGAFDSATVEWRLFNASTKPETMHAWLILSHALTALAMTHRVGTLPVNGYGQSSLTSRKEVQSWIEQNAPLTDDEIQVIRGAVARSKRMKREDRSR